MTMKFSDPNFDLDTFLAQYRVTRHRGFLPCPDPLRRLSSNIEGADAYEDMVYELRELQLAGQVRERVEKLPNLNVSQIKTKLEQERAMLVLSLIGHAYLHGNPDIGIHPVNKLPEPISKAWFSVANMLGRPPVLSHGSIVVHNWRRLRKDEDENTSGADIHVGNIATINTFGHGWDEDWFYLITVEIEARAAPGLVALTEILHLLKSDHLELSNEELCAQVNKRLEILKGVLDSMLESLLNMKLQNYPYIFYNRLRPYLSGWKGNPNFPDGVVYQGVDPEPKYYHGGSAAQSAILHVIDEALGVKHESEFLAEMRNYMPKDHRGLVEEFEQNSDVLRNFVKEKGNDDTVSWYDSCIEANDKFRSEHVKIVARYIVAESKDPHQEKGTGGTTPMPFLKGVRNEVKPYQFKKK